MNKFSLIKTTNSTAITSFLVVSLLSSSAWAQNHFSISNLSHARKQQITIPVLATEQAYYEDPVDHYPTGVTLISSDENEKQNVRVVVLKDDTTKKYHIGIRGTSFNSLSDTLREKGALSAIDEYRNLFHNMSVFSNEMSHEDISLLILLNYLVDNYKKSSKTESTTLETVRNLCRLLPPMSDNISTVGSVCGAIAGGAIGSLSASYLPYVCDSKVGKSMVTLLGAYLGTKGASSLGQKFQSSIDQDLLSAIHYLLLQYAKVYELAVKDGYTIEISGHSLGGFFADMIGAITGDQVWTFNAPGGGVRFLKKHIPHVENILSEVLPHLSEKSQHLPLSHRIKNRCENGNTEESLTFNVKRPNDVIARFGHPCGPTYFIDTKSIHQIETVAQYVGVQHAIDLLADQLTESPFTTLNQSSVQSVFTTLKVLKAFKENRTPKTRDLLNASN